MNYELRFFKDTNKIPTLLNSAYHIRKKNFADEITFTYPVKTRPISVTGNKCELNCAHCGGHYLKNMSNLDKVLAEPNEKSKSYLISGGFNAEGRIPLFPHLIKLRCLKETSSLNFHVGLISKEEAQDIEELADTVCFDFVGDNETIKEVYGLSATVSDYIKTYNTLIEVMGINRVIPHITVGLYRANIRSELEALKILSKLGVQTLVLLIFTPTEETKYEKYSPPDLSELEIFMAKARLTLPSTQIYLGCMRPGGTYRKAADILAVKCGLNKIVMPFPKTTEAAASEMGLKILYKEECCVL